MIDASLFTPGVNPTRTHLEREFKHTSPLIGCRFDASGRFVFAGAQDNTIQRWELATGRQAALVGHKSWVRGLTAEPADHLLFSGDYAGRILAWPVHGESPKPRSRIEAHRGWVRAIAISPDGKLLASVGNDHLVKLWSCPGGQFVRALSGHDCHVYNVAFHPNGHDLVSADLKGVVKHWNVSSGAHVRDLDASALYKYDGGFRADIGGVRSMGFDPAGTLLACAGITEVSNAFAGVGKPLVVLFDWSTGKRRQALLPKENFQGTAWGVALHPLGFIVAAGGGAGAAVWFWRPDQAPAFHTLKIPASGRDLCLHPDAERFAVAGADGAVRIYRMTAKAAT